MLQKIWSWLKAHLTNSWMNGITYLAFMAHSGWAALIVLSAAVVFGTHSPYLRGVTAGLVLFAGVKEYGYDANFEIPHQTFKMNTQDFVGYLAGIGLAWSMILLSMHLRGAG